MFPLTIFKSSLWVCASTIDGTVEPSLTPYNICLSHWDIKFSQLYKWSMSKCILVVNWVIFYSIKMEKKAYFSWLFSGTSKSHKVHFISYIWRLKSSQFFSWHKERKKSQVKNILKFLTFTVIIFNFIYIGLMFVHEYDIWVIMFAVVKHQMTI